MSTLATISVNQRFSRRRSAQPVSTCERSAQKPRTYASFPLTFDASLAELKISSRSGIPPIEMIHRVARRRLSKDSPLRRLFDSTDVAQEASLHLLDLLGQRAVTAVTVSEFKELVEQIVENDITDTWRRPRGIGNAVSNNGSGSAQPILSHQDADSVPGCGGAGVLATAWIAKSQSV